MGHTFGGADMEEFDWLGDLLKPCKSDQIWFDIDWEDEEYEEKESKATTGEREQS